MSSTTIPVRRRRMAAARAPYGTALASRIFSTPIAGGCLLIASALIAPPALSESPDAPLTLQGAVEAALSNNFAVQQAASAVRMREGEAVHAGRLVPSNPVLSARTARRDGPDGQSTDFGIAITQSLFTAGKGELAEQAARNRQGEAERTRARLHR